MLRVCARQRVYSSWGNSWHPLKLTMASSTEPANHLDDFDIRILQALQSGDQMTHSTLAERVPLSASQISRRIQRLEQEGYIERRVAILNSERLGLGVTAYVTIVMRSHAEAQIDAFRQRLLRLPEVLECCKITGAADYLLKIMTADLQSYNHILTEYLLKAPEVANVHSGIVLEQVKRTTALPLPRVPRNR
jgi:Lrp/AsnC family leucine-responsive transcriptional regulator